MTEHKTELTETTGPSISRRTLLRSTAAATGAATVGVGSDHLGISPVGDAEAIVPIVVGAGAAVSTGWALREYEVLGSDDPPEGLTPEALHLSVWEASLTRRSNVDSTFVDNRNLVESGAKHTAYSDGKIAAIEQINEEDSESDVQDAAADAVDDYFTTLYENLLKSWNELLEEIDSQIERVEEHADLEHGDVWDSDWMQVGLDADEYELPDGSTMTVHEMHRGGTNEIEGHPFNLDPADWSNYVYKEYLDPDSDDVRYLGRLLDDDGDATGWLDLALEMEEIRDSVHDGIITWVSGVYGDVQAGDLDPEELLTPREMAELTSDDEDFPQAVADLMALNISVDLEREAEVFLPHVDATLSGTIGWTEDGTLETGEYDPEVEDGDFYLTYDVSLGEGTWDAVETGVDGGVVTFTSEPFEESLFQIETTAGETAQVETEDFEHDEDANVWTVDVSEQLEDSITEVEEVRYYSQVEETQFETILLSEEFEIVTFTDSDGNEHDSADFTRSEPQDDTNYISEEEWNEMQQRHEELIDKYEEAQSGGGGLPFDPDDWAIGPIPGGGVIGGLAVLVLIVLGALNPTN